MSEIKCKQCGHENDLTRVFCQNCGTRLERPEGAAGPKISGPSRVPTGPRKTKRSGIGLGAVLNKTVRAVISTAVLGALIAMLIQMSRKPEGVPEAKTPNDALATQTYQTLVTFSESPYGRGYDLTESQINNYLAARIVQATATDGATVRAKFQRAFVTIKEGEAAFYIEQNFQGIPIFMYLTAVPEKVGTTTTFKTTGGGVGHVPFNAKFAALLERVIGPVVASASEASTPLQSASSIVLVPSAAKVTWAGKKPLN